MAEYRSSHFRAADAAMIAAANGGKDNPHLAGTSAFYRAMSLFRQGKEKEARELALETASTIKPLPKDDKNPLADDAGHDDLILWMTYKEAMSLINLSCLAAPAHSNEKSQRDGFRIDFPRRVLMRAMEGLWLNDKLAVPGLSRFKPTSMPRKLKTPATPKIRPVHTSRLRRSP